MPLARAGPPVAAAALALAVLAAALVVLAGRPLATDDFWWHLKMGELYVTRGLWLAGDPLSHTATHAPAPHQWLFGVSLYGLERVVGLQGLRAVHALAVCGILALALAIFRRAAGALAPACLATAAFIAIAWWRLFQLRPDLVSIAIALGVYRLLLEPRAAPPGGSDGPARALPGWNRVAAAVALMVVWANAHTLFAIGPALLVAALLGVALRAALAAWAGLGEADERPRAARWAISLGLILAATLANPRGIAQHLTFFESAETDALWVVRDEWAHFSPLSASGYGPAMSGLSFAVTDAVIALFALAALASFARFARRRDEASLRAFDPVGFGLGLAGLVALGVAVRFAWMSALALVYALRAVRALHGWDAAPARWAAAAAAVAIAAAFFFAPNWRAATLGVPGDVAGYLGTPYDGHKYYAQGVEFLRETGLEGRMFNPYALGGFAAYWLAPRLTTFVDGRMNFGADVLADYRRITQQRGVPGGRVGPVLDRRGVDVFFGVGVPVGRRDSERTLYTTANLEREPDWLLVSRSMRHSVYLRKGERNRANLQRVAAWYAEQGVPFDPARGLDVSRVIAERPDWASRHELLPEQYEQLLAATHSAKPALRAAAVDGLALAHALAGAYLRQLGYDAIAAQLQPRAKPPLQRSIYALLRLDRPQPAVENAERLLALDPGDARSQRFADVARRYLEQTRELRSAGGGPASDVEINELPLLAE